MIKFFDRSRFKFFSQNADDVWMNRAPGPLPQYKDLAKGVLAGMESDLSKHKFLAADHITVLGQCRLFEITFYIRRFHRLVFHTNGLF